MSVYDSKTNGGTTIIARREKHNGRTTIIAYVFHNWYFDSGFHKKKEENFMLNQFYCWLNNQHNKKKNATMEQQKTCQTSKS
jgi:hypothetical protein